MHRGFTALTLALALVLALGLRAPVLSAQEADDVAPPEAALVARSPWIAPEGAADFVLRVANVPDDATVRLSLYSALGDVEDLETSESRNVGFRLFVSPHLPLAGLGRDADGNAIVTLKTSEGAADEYTARLRRSGIYPLVITVHGPDGGTLAAVRTPVVRLGSDDDPLPAPRLGVLLDIGASPTLLPDGTRVLEPTWAAEVQGVSELLADHPDLGISVAAVPDTLDALAVATEPELVALATRVTAGEPILLPYTPVAAESLRTTDLIGLLPGLLDLGRKTIGNATGKVPLQNVWDPAADFGSETAEILSGLGFDHVLVGSDDLHEAVDPDDDVGDDADEPEPRTLDDGFFDAGPVELVDIAPLDALVVDTLLSSWLARTPSDGVDAPHLALAEVLLRDDGEANRLLVRAEAPAPRSVLADLLFLLDRPDAPVEVGGIEELLEDPEPEDRSETPGDSDPEIPVLEWRGGIRPDLSRIAERILDTVPLVETFSTVIGEDDARADELRLQVATSVGAFTPSDRRVAAIDIVEATVRDALAAIRLAGQNDLNLTSRRGTLPITITNANEFTVRVVLRVRSDRLSFPEGELQTLDIPPESTRIDIPVEALATGSVPVFLELWTVDDRVRLDTRQLNVRSTAISGVGLALSLGALAVLTGWWIRSWRRNRSVDPGMR